MVRIVPRHSHAVDSHLWEGYSADSSFFQFANRLSGDHGGDILRSPIVSDCVLIRVNILEHLQATSSAGIVERIAAEHPCGKAVLRLQHSRWESLGRCCQFIKTLRTQVHVRDEFAIMDTLRSPAS